MKKTTLFLTFMLCFAGTANAQFFKKLKKKAEQAAEKAVERKVEQKTTKETEKAFDSTFNKQKTNKRNSKKGGMSTPVLSKVDPAESYVFNHKAVMYMKSGKEEMDIDYYLPKSDDFFGMSIKDERIQDDFIMVYDAGREAMFTYMENGGQKMKMGISFKTDYTNNEAPVFDIKATGNTKTILGYSCKEYKMTGEDMTATIWVTKDVDIRFPSTLYSDKKNKSNNQEWMKDLDGWAMEMEMIDTSRRKPHVIIMKCLLIETSDFKINSNEYQNMGY